MPAVAGIGLATAFGMGAPIARSLWDGDRAELAVYGLLFAICLFVTLFWHLPTIQVLLGAGTLAAVFNVLWQRFKGGKA